MSDDLKSWDEGANTYLALHSEDEDPFKKYIDSPKLLESLGNVAGKKVIDIGCGNGDLVKQLAAMGADVIGIDGSEKMIEAAKSNFPGGKFEVGDVLDENFLLDKQYDIAISKMMLMNLTPIHLFAENVFNLLNEEGLFVVDVVHPLRSLLKHVLAGDKKKTGHEYNYFEEFNHGVEFGDKTYTFYYRPIQMYVNEILAEKFILLGLHEYGVDEALVSKFPQLADKLNMPVSMHLVFRK